MQVIDNKSGQLCGHYPSELLVIEGHRMSSSHPTGYDIMYTHVHVGHHYSIDLCLYLTVEAFKTKAVATTLLC